MLLTELVDLLSEHLNICNNVITNILQKNNIRINQRLLLEKAVIMNNNRELLINDLNPTNVEKDVKAEPKAKAKSKVEETKPVETKVEDIITTNINKPVRGRGRPRKNTVMKEEEEEICVEVEEIDVDGRKYYKTWENVILSKELKIEGILRDGKIVKGV
jgi:hypothetical protein